MKINRAFLLFISIGVFLFLSLLVLLGINIYTSDVYNKTDHITDVDNCYTDAERLGKAFPVFGTIQKCYWDSGIVYKDNFFESLMDIGPGSYWVNGYAVIDRDDMDRIVENYEWKNADSDSAHFKAILDQIREPKSPAAWMVNEDFSMSVGGYYGDFYVNPKDNIIVFDMVHN